MAEWRNSDVHCQGQLIRVNKGNPFIGVQRAAVAGGGPHDVKIKHTYEWESR